MKVDPSNWSPFAETRRLRWLPRSLTSAEWESRPRIHILAICASALLLIGLTCVGTLMAVSPSGGVSSVHSVLQFSSFGSSALAPISADPPPPRVLILYVWSNNDRNYLDNLRDFIARVVRPDSGCDYVFILNQSPDAPHWNPLETSRWPGPNSYVDSAHLPALPPGSMYIDHPNECYDSGTWGWFFSLLTFDALRAGAFEPHHSQRRQHAPPRSAMPPYWNEAIHSGLSQRYPVHEYQYFVLMNASIRGPFFPSYMDLDARDKTTGRLIWPPWYYPFVHLMEQDPDVKLAGATASCERKAHVQSYFLFTDQIGLSLIRAGPALECHRNFQSAIDHGEFGLSGSVLNAGYNIAGLLSPRQGAEFRGVDADGRVLPTPLSGQTSAYCGLDPPAERARNPLWYPPEDVPLNMFDTVFIKWQEKGERPVAVAKHMEWQRDIKRNIAYRQRRERNETEAATA